MDTSSGSESYDRTRGHRARGREAHRRSVRDGGRAGGSGGGDRTVDISDKINTLANTLEDTSRNLSKVDRMLGQYREHSDEQAEAMALLRENLEESINQLQTQRPSRSNGARSESASASPLHTSDLEGGSWSEGQRFYPTSPLRDYTGTATQRPRRRRSQSVGVRFKDANMAEEDIHSLHQSLRDVRCDQQRLSHDLDREILRRNRSDIDTRTAMEKLTGHLTTSLGQDSMSSRVERRLQELEREMRSETRSLDRERRPAMQETLGRQVSARDSDEATTARVLKAETEKSKMEQDLKNAQRLLEQSEGSRESLFQQVENMREELLRTRKENSELQKAQLESSQHTAQTHGNREERSGLREPGRSDLEKEVAELRVQLRKAFVVDEVEELRRALDRKEKEKLRLSLQVEELSSDMVRREQQQLRMLEQLREMQSRGQEERKHMESLVQESSRSRDELKIRAQEAVHQWRAKCKRMQKELEEAKSHVQFHTEKAHQATREKESSQAQLKVLSQQTEAARKELPEILGRLAHREEELHRKDVALSEARQRQFSLEQEIQEVRQTLIGLEEQTQCQAAVQAKLREENHRLEEQANIQARRNQREQDAHAELQASLKRMTTAHAQLAQRLAEEESSRKELQKGASELQSKLATTQEEQTALRQQLQLERDVHQKELENMKAVMEDGVLKKDREMQLHLMELKADAASDKELCGILRLKLDRMKDECDKLATQLSAKDEAQEVLQRKYHLLKQKLDDKIKSDERRCDLESELQEKLLRMEAEQEAILSSVGEELDAACRSLDRNGEGHLKGISQKPGLVKDPHRWFTETKTKLRWLCEEVRACVTKEQRLRKQHQQARDQIKTLRQSRDSEHVVLLQRLDEQEELLRSLNTEKKELLEKNRRKEEEMRSLQDRVLDVEMSTRMALNHLESIPEKQCLMEDFKDLEESQRQIEVVEQRYAKYKEVVWDLQHQLDESKRKIQEYRDEKMDATSRSLKLAALCSSIKGTSPLLSSSQKSDTLSPHKHLTSSALDDSAVKGVQTP
ncbi:centrosomal protein of 128 kDa isoform X2 [Cynoglossus semilaevis]|uniref:Centrosomal protein 128 n=1 Tax=Cynoglossus semilaevis TaxID=244447 RepID=A0A3P8WS86_CYNSE|nr:centrosomal protein of 128 kDa isoform X2 [Cynoglossus semilaevis]